MHLLIVFGNRFNVGIPSIFSPHFLKSLSSHRHWIVVRSSTLNTASLSFTESLSICLVIITTTSTRWLCYLLPFCWWCSQGRYGIGLHLSSNIFMINFILVRNVTIKNERSCIKWSLESTLSRFHSWAILGSILNTHCLDSFSSYWLFWGILSKEFWISHCGVIECDMIIHWSIEVLSITTMSVMIILGAFYIEIRNPTELTIDISIFWNTWIVRHSSSFNFVHLIWIMFSSWF